VRLEHRNAIDEQIHEKRDEHGDRRERRQHEERFEDAVAT
jgi:hypothetical protein